MLCCPQPLTTITITLRLYYTLLNTNHLHPLVACCAAAANGPCVQRWLVLVLLLVVLVVLRVLLVLLVVAVVLAPALQRSRSQHARDSFASICQGGALAVAAAAAAAAVILVLVLAIVIFGPV
jgi:hypothetical protein